MLPTAETFIRTLDGKRVKHFAPRKMQANHPYVRANPDAARVFVHVESEAGASEWRPLELFDMKPPLDRIELYGANSERSKLERDDPRVVTALRAAGGSAKHSPNDTSAPSRGAAIQASSSQSGTVGTESASELPPRDGALPEAVRAALLRDGTDEPAIANRRRDQRAIRNYLLAGAEQAACVVCGSLLPAEFLIAAHIVPRSQCCADERLDMRNLALMCSLGCDALFESGVISIQRGTVILGPTPALSEALAERVSLLSGRRAIGLHPETEAYLERKRTLVRK